LGDAKDKPVLNLDYDEKGEVPRANPAGNDCEVPAGYEGVELVMGKIVIFLWTFNTFSTKNIWKIILTDM